MRSRFVVEPMESIAYNGGNMMESADPESEYEFVRRRDAIERRKRGLSWTAGGVVVVAIVILATLTERKRIHWKYFSPDGFMPAGLVIGGLLALFLLWKVPLWQVRHVKDLQPKERFDRVNEARKTLATILGGVVLLAGFFGTWQNIKVAQESAATSQRALIV